MRTTRILLVAVATSVAVSAAGPAVVTAKPRVASTPAFTGPAKKVRTGTPTGTTPARPVRPSLKLADAVGRPTPHVAVDDAGTAYVTWLLATDPTSGTEGGIGFCRLPRGATACDNPPGSRVLRPQKATYGPGDDPAFNQDAGGGAYPLVLGDQLFVLSTRSVTTYATPAGDSTTTTIAFASTDGGATFSGGLPVAADLALATRPVQFGPGDNPLIGLLGATGGSLAGGGSVAFTSLQGGSFSTDRIVFPTATAGVLAPLPGGGIAVGYPSAGGAAVQRAAAATRPSGPESFSAPQRVPGTALTGLGAGPAGLTAFALGGATAALNERVVATPLDGGGAPVALTADSAQEPIATTAGAAPGAQLVTAYKDVGDPVSANGLYVRRSPDGRGFTAPERLTAASEGVFLPDVAAAPDGGGVAVWQSGETDGEVRAATFGPQGRLTAPGLPGTTPGAGSATGDGGVTRECQRIAVAAVQVTTADGVGCFLPGIGADKGSSVSNGPVLYNGLRITPLGGSQIVLRTDRAAKSVTLYSTGTVTVDIPGNEAGDIRIFQGQLKQKLTAKVGQPVLDLPKFPTQVRGFRVANALAPLATAGFGVSIPVDVDLGPQFFGLTGHADLVVTPTGGLRLDTLRIRQGTLPLGPVVVEGLDVTWTRDGNRWSGTGAVTIPGGARLALQAQFDGTSFAATATYDLPFPGVQLFPSPPVFLHRVAAGLEVNRNNRPLVVNGGVGVGAVPVSPGRYLLDLDGTIALTFANPFVVQVRGSLAVLGLFDVANASLRAGSDGVVLADLEVGAIDKNFLYVGAKVRAGVSAAGFEGKGQGEVCIGIFVVGACKDLPEGYVSSRGIAGCASFDGEAYTVTYRWGGPIRKHAGPTCFYDDISVGLISRTALRQAGGGLTVPAGARSVSIDVQSATGAPQVDVLDPAGVPVPLDAAFVEVGSSETVHATTIQINQPAPGRYRVVPRPGTPALTGVQASVPAPAPTVTGSVSRARGSRRTVSFRVRGNADATVALVERTRTGDVPLKAGGRGGTVSFTPNALVAGRHQIVARVSSGDGFVLQEKVIASFVQPTPRGPATPRRVRVRRAGTAVQVRVTRGRGPATRLIVTGRYGDGARASAVVPPGRSTARLPAPARSLDAPGPLRVTVVAISTAGVRSGTRSGSLTVRGSQRAPRTQRRR